MGTVCAAECSCGYKYSRIITVGWGRSAQDNDMIRKDIPSKVYETFFKECTKDNIEIYALGNAITICTRCKKTNVVSRFRYRLKNADNEFLYIADCPVCGGKTEEINDTDNIICPKCGRKMTIMQRVF